MTCHPPWLPQPPLSFFNLLLMAWTYWTNSLHSWFTWLLFQEGENRHPFQPNFEAHQPPIPLSPYQAQGTFIIQTPQRPYTKFTLHCPQSNYQGPRHPSQQISQNKIQARIIFQHILLKEDQQMMFQDKTSPQRHLQAV